MTRQAFASNGGLSGNHLENTPKVSSCRWKLKFIGRQITATTARRQLYTIRNWKASPLRLPKRNKHATNCVPCFQTWKQSLAIKFVFDLASFVSSALLVSGVGVIGAVGLHRSRDELVVSKDKLHAGTEKSALEEKETPELPSFSDYRFDDRRSFRNKKTKF